MNPTPPPNLDDARCWTCGYQLRGVASLRCPECGRAFDPANPKSMNFAGAIGRVGRLLLRMPGWPTFALMLVATGLIVYGTGMPRELQFRSEDRVLLGEWLQHRDQWRSWSPRWNTYAAGIVTAAVVTVWLLLRLLLRGLTVLLRHPPDNLRQTRHRPLAATAFLALIIFAFVAIGGSARIANEWAHNALRTRTRPIALFGGVRSAPPIDASRERHLELLNLILTSRNPMTRRAGLRILAEYFPDQVPTVVRRLAPQERDPEVLATALRLLGAGGWDVDAFFEPFLDDPRPAIRAAAADCLSIARNPAHQLDYGAGGYGFGPMVLDGPVPIVLVFPRGSSIESLPLSAARRQKLERMMLTGPTTDEREAAARSLVRHPPFGYKLRLAEWGVWLNEDGDLKAVKAVEADVPRFVHRTGNPVAEMADRVQQPIYIVTKPVIHLTSNVPLAVDLDVRIRHGRPWFAYPMPDDFEVNVEAISNVIGTTPAPGPFLAPLDNAPLGSLPQSRLRSGYPWLTPSHRVAYPPTQNLTFRGRNPAVSEVVDMGVRWQSVIVSPAKLPWMNEPDVGPDPRHQWWKRLRDVDCSWVSSRNESERFLYYDGPTLLKMDVRPVLKGAVLTFSDAGVPLGREQLGRPQNSPAVVRPDPTGARSLRWALFIDSTPGRLTGIPVSPAVRSQDLAAPAYLAPTLTADAVEARLKQELLSRGLNDSECAGLLDCWREDFFRKPGKRVLMILTPRDYETFCPLTIRPTPTERARVGIIITEFPN